VLSVPELDQLSDFFLLGPGLEGWTAGGEYGVAVATGAVFVVVAGGGFGLAFQTATWRERRRALTPSIAASVPASLRSAFSTAGAAAL
jgi:hypothetical protein